MYYSTLFWCGAVGRHTIANIFDAVWKCCLNCFSQAFKSALNLGVVPRNVLIHKRTLLVGHSFIIHIIAKLGILTLLRNGFALGFDGVSTPISTQAADVVGVVLVCQIA